MPDTAEERTEHVVLATGYPSATSDDEARPRCKFDRGYFVPSGLGGEGEERCEHCLMTADEVNECYRPPDDFDRLFREGDGGRYALNCVYADGNPFQVARVTTLAAALQAEEGCRRAKGHAHAPHYFVTDVDDGERGALHELSYDPARDVGPDPEEAPWPF